MNKVMNHMNKFIHYFNLSFGVGLVLALALTVGRVYFGGLEGLDLFSSPKVSLERIPSQETNQPTETTQTQESATHSDETVVYGEVGLTSEQMALVAKNIYHVARAMDEKYVVADGLGLGMYVLRYMAEIGEYEMAQKDILILVDAFEKLGNMEVGAEVDDILAQIKKIRFGRKNGKLFAQIFARIPERGVEIAINEKSEDSNSSVEEIEKVVVKNGAILSFEEITKTEQIRDARNFIKDPVKVLGGFESLVDELYQIQDAVAVHVDRFFMRDDLLAPALSIEMEGIYVAIDTSTVFDHIDFNFNRAVVLPGMSKINSDGEEERLSSFFLGAKAKLLNLKVSIDQ